MRYHLAKLADARGLAFMNFLKINPGTFATGLTAITLLAVLSSVVTTAHASTPRSWSYNDDAGFGIYQPEGWRIVRNGRSSKLLGPLSDSAQTEIFIGSDWRSKIRSLEDLRQFAMKEYNDPKPRAIQIAGLDGFEVGMRNNGARLVLRQPENFIVVTYHLKGSSEQIAEAELALTSIDIRTKGIEATRSKAPVDSEQTHRLSQ